jgi:branched-chain amino acid transport system permease protein
VINDREISQAIGINVNRIYMGSFTLGVFCAALGGALIAPTIAVAPGFAVDATVLAFAVIAIGGMGNLEGAALGALMVGLLRATAVHLLPEADLVVIYLAMIVVLVVRPQGLLGQLELRRI